MLLDLNKLHGARDHFERTFQPDAFDPQDDEYRVAAPVEVSLDVQKLDGEAFGVAGRATTKLEVGCSRCLEPFQFPVDAAFDLRYV
ncbi:MAG: YceD family protein, partial [Vicinamibacterales bacterium]